MTFSRPAVVLDAETTGVNPAADRIVSLALIILEPGCAPVERYRLVDPECPIPEEATAIHGISDNDVAGAPTFKQLALGLQGLLSGPDLIGFGLSRFDVPLLAAEFERVGIEWEPTGAVVDAMRIFHHFNPRDLSAAVQAYCDREHDGAHDALSDARAALDVLTAQIEAHELDTHDLEALEALTRDPSWVDRDGKLRRDSAGVVRVTFGKHAGTPVVELPPDYVTWMLAQGRFSRSVQVAIREAMTLPDLVPA